MNNWLPTAEVGDVFRWRSVRMHNAMCQITEFRDNDCQIEFVYITGPSKGRHGYTLLPQDVELVSVIDLLAALVEPGRAAT